MSKILRKISKIPNKVILPYRKWLAKPLLKQQVSYFDLKNEWDVLILLDACRYDSFAELNFIPGELSHKISLGSCTRDWAKENIIKPHKNVVYVSANPYLSNYYLEKWNVPDPFFHLEELWDKGWDDKLNTVHPKKVTQTGLKMAHKFPNKKLVLHYMQPHTPFIGKKWIAGTGWRIARDVVKGKKQLSENPNTFERLKNGQLTKQELIEAYNENLLLALKEVESFINEFSQKLTKRKKPKIIITADHGECFGEYGVYSHPELMPIEELIKVPWFKVKI